MVKSILKKRQLFKKQTKRVSFNKYKKVKTFKKKSTVKSTKQKKSKSRTKTKKRGPKGKKNKKKKGKKTRKRNKKNLKLKMKGGCGSNMGEKITGYKYNATPQQQYPASTNLNSSIPTPYQSGGSVLETLGLGDASLFKNHIINASKNIMNVATGNDKAMSANPTIHPTMEKSLIKFPEPIDVKTIHDNSKNTDVN